jgi:hypothetical protein
MTTRILLVAGLSLFAAGCAIDDCVVYGPDEPSSTVIIEQDNAYVDTYLPLPHHIRQLIAPRVAGYFSPPTSRYSSYLYYQEQPRSSQNEPCFVQGDFNGDLIDDYAFLFSHEDDYGCSWDLTTRLIVVQSVPYGSGYEVTTDIEVGSVSAGCAALKEENWSLCRMPRGDHTYTTVSGGTTVTETVTLENDAFLLTALDSGERDLFYSDGGDIYYMPWTPGSFAKKKSADNRTVTAGWQQKVPRKIKQ